MSRNIEGDQDKPIASITTRVDIPTPLDYSIYDNAARVIGALQIGMAILVPPEQYSRGVPSYQLIFTGNDLREVQSVFKQVVVLEREAVAALSGETTEVMEFDAALKAAEQFLREQRMKLEN